MIVRLTSKDMTRIKLNTFFHKEVIIDNSVTGLNTQYHQAADPSIVWDPVNKRWLIYFFANESGSAEIYVAESKDLFNVKFLGKAVPRGNSGKFDSASAQKPGAIYYNGKYYLFYRGDDGTYNRIGLAISDDGVNFIKYANNPILTDPEGTGYLDSPSVIRWKDGNFYMWVYNGNGYNLVFRTTPDKFPVGWKLIGKLESNKFGIYSVEAFYDDEIDKILLLANIFYPKPSGVSEPGKTGSLAIFVGDEPLKLTYYGTLLTPPVVDTRSYPLRYCNSNVFAASMAKVGSGKYVILFNCMETDATSERIFRMDLGVDREQTLHIVNVESNITDYLKMIPILRLPPGTKAVLKHAYIYAYSGTPTQMYIYDGNSYPGSDNVIAWTNSSVLEYRGNEIIINDEYFGIVVVGGSPSNSISIAYSFEVTIKPAMDEI
jgi:hypothetical protein